MRTVSGTYIPKKDCCAQCAEQRLGNIVLPDGGVDEIIVTAQRLTNWPAIALLGVMGLALFKIMNQKHRRR